MTPKVVLLLRIRTRQGKRTYVRPVVSGNHQLRALWGIVNHRPEHHPRAPITSAIPWRTGDEPGSRLARTPTTP